MELQISSTVFEIKDDPITSIAKKDGISGIYWDLTWESEKAMEQARTTIFGRGVQSTKLTFA